MNLKKRVEKLRSRVKVVCAIILLGAIILVSGVIYFTFFHNPLIPVSLPIRIVIHQEFNVNTLNISVVIKRPQNNTFTLSENLTLRPYMITYSRIKYDSFTTQKYSSDQTIQLSAYKNGSEYGIAHNFTLPRIHLHDMESPSRFNETEKWIVNAFYIELDPTQVGQTLITRAWFRPHWELYTNQVSFWFVLKHDS